MSWYDYLFDNKIIQRNDIEKLKKRDEQSRDQARMRNNLLNERFDELFDKQGEAALYIKTLVTILIKKKVFSPEEFLDVMDEIDVADGVKDGKTQL